MSFNDEDFRRLKELDRGASTTIGSDDLRALLARLEAERACADLLELYYEAAVFDDLDEGDVALIARAIKARGKAAGK